MILGRHGFGYIIEETGLYHLLSLPKRWIWQQEYESMTLAQRIRIVLEELGPTFVKLGQLASTRTDLLPESIILELIKLQDQVPAFPGDEAKRIIEEQFGLLMTDLFREFHEIPIAAASIGQVHKGQLRSGEIVAIKIQRPDIVQSIERDLEILYDLVELARKHVAWVTRYQVPQMVEQFARSMIDELDYSHEGRSTEKIGRQFEKDPDIHIPKVYWEFTSAKVLTMEFVEGVHLSQVDEIVRRGFDLSATAEKLVLSLLHQIFIGDIFHADPHPGNLIIRRDGSLAYIDFGMVGRLDANMKEQLSSLIIALMRGNTNGMIRALLRMGVVSEENESIPDLHKDLDRMREQYYGLPFSDISMGQALNDLLATANRHHITLPPDLVMLGKALLTMEGVALMLDPNLSILKLAEPFGRKLVREKYNSRRISKKLIGGAAELAETLIELPKQVRQLSSLIGRGKLKVEIGVPELNLFLRKLDQISNRLSFSIVLLAFSIIMVGLIIGSSLNSKDTMLWDIPAIEIGFVVAAIMMGGLLYSIFKSGRF